MGQRLVREPASLSAWAEEVACAEGARAETDGKHGADAEKNSGIVDLVSGMLREASKMNMEGGPGRGQWLKCK